MRSPPRGRSYDAATTQGHKQEHSNERVSNKLQELQRISQTQKDKFQSIMDRVRNQKPVGPLNNALNNSREHYQSRYSRDYSPANGFMSKTQDYATTQSVPNLHLAGNMDQVTNFKQQ